MKLKCEEIEELERKGRYDLMYGEVKSLDYGKKSRKEMWLIEEENNAENGQARNIEHMPEICRRVI